ncbi:MAG: hypothetical protein KA200_00460 [Burkholderiales bacterium]|nr:hypothetical protein [Burkholderiales bacterium]
MSAKAKRLSVALQDIAALLETELASYAGERVAFVLMVNIDGITQYVSNTDRSDGVALVRSLLDRWNAGRADIPAHYNPDLKDK